MTKHLANSVLVFAVFVLGFANLHADPPADGKPRIVSARVGFLSAREDRPTEVGWKTETWAPVLVDVQAGAEALGDGSSLVAECDDPEDVGTQVRVPVALKAGETKRFVLYLRAGTRGEARVVLRTPHGDSIWPLAARPLELQSQLYVTLGGTTPDLVEAIVGMLPKEKQNKDAAAIDTFPRFAAHEPDVKNLPDQWIGYQGVDLAILHPSAKLSDAQEAALNAWVARGGRLVRPMDPKGASKFELKKAPALEEWARVSNKRFPAGTFAEFAEEGAETLVEQNGKPLMVRKPLGQGFVIVLAFPLDQAPFSQWEGRAEFLRGLLARFAPRAINVHNEAPRGVDSEDLTTELQRTLNRFDVRPISFAFVAFLVVLFILAVGPIDYFVLKNVFKRMEWTWLTFPLIVGAASLLAYVSADRIRGHERRLNRIDLVDVGFELSEVAFHGEINGVRERKVFFVPEIRGHSFFGLLSADNESYSMAVEPSRSFFGKKEQVRGGVETLTWLGRPEAYFGGSGRAGASGFLSHPYRYGDERNTLLDVPVPIWGTKTLWSTWRLEGGPFILDADLAYHQKQHQGRDVKITGTIENNLPAELQDAWILYYDYAYPVGALPSGKKTTIGLDASTGILFRDWGLRPDSQEATPTAQGDYDPTKVMKRILFHEKVDNTNVIRNHSLRMLDWSWRLQEEPPTAVRDARLRDAILYARVKRLQGDADALQKDGKTPTKLRLETKTGFAADPTPLNAPSTQDTFVRVLFRVRPHKE